MSQAIHTLVCTYNTFSDLLVVPTNKTLWKCFCILLSTPLLVIMFTVLLQWMKVQFHQQLSSLCLSERRHALFLKSRAAICLVCVCVCVGGGGSLPWFTSGYLFLSLICESHEFTAVRLKSFHENYSVSCKFWYFVSQHRE